MISRKFSIPERSSFFLLGPRGTGKSYFARHEFDNSIYINLLEDQTYRALLANPGRMADLIPARYGELVIIDEIQKIPALLDEIHRLIEERKIRFMLTGSSARRLKRDGANLLAGRAYSRHAFPLTAFELKDQFDFRRACQTGLLPKAYLETDSGDYLASYVTTYLKEEVEQEGFVRNIGSFARFLEAASFSQGQVLNYANVAAECAVERKTVVNYFQILDDLLLSHTLSVFSLRAKRELIKHQKFYFFDVGVYREIRPTGPLDSAEEILGPSVETLVLQELIARNEYQDWNYKISFWHTKTHIEVDFILYGERGLKAIEVKSSSRIRDDDFAGLLAFKSDYPKADLFLLYAGKEARFHKDVRIVPLFDFLLNADRYI